MEKNKSNFRYFPKQVNNNARNTQKKNKKKKKKRQKSKKIQTVEILK
jgi:hypothetical protein